jgi:S-adenosylmethionine uptake transporter
MRLTPIATLTGALLVIAYTALISSADAITKLLSGGYAAPQLFAVSGGLVALFSGVMARAGGEKSLRSAMKTTQPWAMGLRSLTTVIAAVAFFYGFKLLPFAEVFVFIGLMPLIAGLMSGPILREHVSLRIWMALAAGFIGIACLFPAGFAAVTLGHIVALIAAASGTFSMVMARYVGKHESNSLALVFYPNLALMISMLLVLPFFFKPMALGDLGLAVLYAGFLFGARWVLVVALRLLPAYVAMPLLNVQFLWMVGIGIVIFGETPGLNIWLGAAIVIASGIYVVYDQLTEPRRSKTKDPALKVAQTLPPAE